jgi:hypothetical protein
MAEADGRYENLVAAGLITSVCRAMVWQAARKHPGSVALFATDSVLARTRLHLPIGPHLGQWEEKRRENIWVIMAGVYGNYDDFARTRGLAILQDQWRMALNELRRCGRAEIYTHLFVTHSLADLHPEAYGPYRLRILTPSDRGCNRKELNVQGDGYKRRYNVTVLPARWRWSELHDLYTFPESVPLDRLNPPVDEDLAEAECYGQDEAGVEYPRDLAELAL